MNFDCLKRERNFDYICGINNKAMEYEVDHMQLQKILSERSDYAEIVNRCMSQYLGLEEGSITIPGEKKTCTGAVIKFLIDANVLSAAKND